MKYLLDTNVLIHAVDWFSFQICPGFWDFLSSLNDAGLVFSLSAVRSELEKQEDELAHWASERGERFFLSETQESLGLFGELMVWTQSLNYSDAAKSRFSSGADARLIAFAKAHHYRLITHEVSSSGSRKKIKIPDICRSYGVSCGRLTELLHAAGARFILDPHWKLPAGPDD